MAHLLIMQMSLSYNKALFREFFFKFVWDWIWATDRVVIRSQEMKVR